MPSSATQRSNNHRPNPNTAPNSAPINTLLDISTWDGGQATQAAWFNLKLHEAQDDFGFVQLNKSATVAGSQLRGIVAVFSPAHGLEHARQENVGTFRKPNMRQREDLSTYRASTAHGTSSHGGYPTPTPTSSAKTPSILDAAMGDLASSYKIAAEVIEEEDLRYLNHFLDSITSERLRRRWKTKANQSGRLFVTQMLSEMEENGVTLTAEDTVAARMKAILEGGLAEATFSCFLDVTGAYEDWNEVLETPIPEATRAHSYKKLIQSTSSSRNTLPFLIAFVGTSLRACNKNPRKNNT